MRRLAVLALGFGCLAGGVLPAPACADEVLAYAWADQPRRESYNPARATAFNSAGGQIGIVRFGPGRYQVGFQGLAGMASAGQPMNVMVYGPGPADCRLAAVDINAQYLVASVRCTKPDGGGGDARFHIAVLPGGAGTTALGDLSDDIATDEESTMAAPATAPVGPVKILENGAVEYQMADGSIRRCGANDAKTCTTILPDGTQQTLQLYQTQPPTPPTAPPDSVSANWLDFHGETLLGVMRDLANDETSIATYLDHEQATADSIYDRVSKRTRAICFMVGNMICQ